MGSPSVWNRFVGDTFMPGGSRWLTRGRPPGLAGQPTQWTEDHFQRAAKSGAVETENALQNPVQQPSAPSRMESPETEKSLDSQELLLVGAGECESVQDWQMTPTGFEPVSRP